MNVPDQTNDQTNAGLEVSSDTRPAPSDPLAELPGAAGLLPDMGDLTDEQLEANQAAAGKLVAAAGGTGGLPAPSGGAPASPSAPPGPDLAAAHTRANPDKWDQAYCTGLPLAKLSREEIEAELAALPDWNARKAEAGRAYTDACARRDEMARSMDRAVHESHVANVALVGQAQWALERLRLLTIERAKRLEAERIAAEKARAEAEKAGQLAAAAAA